MWCPPPPEPGADAPPGVRVHPLSGRFRAADLRRAGALLDASPRTRRLFVQWVPHSFGPRAVNLPLCRWLRRRAQRSGDRLDLLVHEPFLPFRAASLRQSLAAAVQRAMIALLLASADRVFLSTTAWASRLERFPRHRGSPLLWLPVPGNIRPVGAPDRVAAVRRRYAGGGGALLGRFGSCPRHALPQLARLLAPLVLADEGRSLLLLGEGSGALRRRIAEAEPGLLARLHAPGYLPPAEVSIHLQACDLLVQPYPDGVTTRRGTLMAALEHGLPTVSNRGPATEELWSAGAPLALVDDDAGAMARAVDELLAAPGPRRRLGERGRRLYAERFAVGHAVAALLAGADGGEAP